MKFEGCGSRNIYGLADFNKAPKGKAQFAEFNSIVSVEDGTKKLCTGTLIDPKVVVTSASCVDGKNANSLKVRLGSWNAAKRMKFDIEEVKKVSKIVLHSQTVNKNQQNVAILLLESPAKTGILVGTSCLSSSKTTFDQKKCAVVGWSSSNAASDNLNVQSVDLTACPPGSPAKSQCVNSLNDFDSGSALVCPVKTDENNGVMQVGILSYKTGNAGVFADLTEFKDWVDTELKSNSIGTENYTYSKLKSRFWWAIASGIFSLTSNILNLI